MHVHADSSILTADVPSGAPREASSDLISRERAILNELFVLVAERARREPRIDKEYHADREALEERFEIAYHDVIVRFATEKEAAEKNIEEERRRINNWSLAEREETDREAMQTRHKVIRDYEKEKQAAKTEFQEARWAITTVYEGNKNTAEAQYKDGRRRVSDTAQQLESIESQAREYLARCKLRFYDLEGPPSQSAPASTLADPLDRYQEMAGQAAGLFRSLRALRTPRLFRGLRWLVVVLMTGTLSLGLLLLISGPAAGGVLLAVGTGSGLVLGGLGCAIAHVTARRSARPIWQQILETSAASRILQQYCEGYLQTNYRSILAEHKRRYRKDLRLAAWKYRRQRQECKDRRIGSMRQAQERYRHRRETLRVRRSEEWTAATSAYRRRRHKMQREYEKDAKRTQDKHAIRMARRAEQFEAEWQSLIAYWLEGMARIELEVEAINRAVEAFQPAWHSNHWQHWTVAESVPPAIHYGAIPVDMAQIPSGLPRHERLKNDRPTSFKLPALLPFPEPFSTLIEAREEGRAQAVRALQLIMLRLLTSLPPGKVRFTIIDPVGLGKNFASFMHLADHDEQLVTSRIWTEMAHIEQRLSDLTAHMEVVIQKYLRNQFDTIEAYNVHAGEVAEPYRILVVANFPFNFTVEAARRLVSIISSGPRCGVHTLISVDTRQPVPQGFDMADLRQPGVKLVWSDGQFLWQDDDFESFPLLLDELPEEGLCTSIMQQVGARALQAKRVEVPFEFVAPSEEEWWKGDTCLGISVPLGRVGATKRQHLRLGHGTAQHVLIAGKTGSGKSTLLHALISNLALTYGPEEVELYLVDFKKGVEFKTYANHQLPHARVVAVESEREFGLSVLQRLDAELKIRGEKFRSLGVQDLKSYRQTSGMPLPRILLIVDEFQEFFVEDDRLAQDASLLLDRLVRQGRAFGLHVLLGSQTLGGAYTLARSTIDQMAVRIALQCSEADAHLILSEDNSAARLLSRPGEAIYNDANGLVEGNNPFQIVWLAEAKREGYLERVRELACTRGPTAARSQIVFEGNAPALAAKNDSLRELLHATSWPAAHPRSVRAWLGEAIAIKDPTMASFRPQSGNNLLIVGQQDEAALGILSAALVAMASQYSPVPHRQPECSRFYILDGTPDDDPLAGILTQVASAVPHRIRLGAWREVAAVVGELAAELDRRQKSNDTESPAAYLIVFGLHRFRDLRRQEDDFSFSRSEDDKANPAKQFATILTEGPSFGIHTLVWCDSLNNLNRSLERAVIREFEMRVVFQMSAADSSNLIDSPLAGKLGMYRAYFHSEEQGKLEKFRPYGVPQREWLEEVRACMHKTTPA